MPAAPALAWPPLVRAPPPPVAAPPAPAPPAPAPEAAPAAAEAGEDAEPNWPTATDEAAYLSGPRAEINLPVPPPASARPAAPEEPVPPVEELIEQIPAEVRATLDELFRARFHRVMRAKPKAL